MMGDGYRTEVVETGRSYIAIVYLDAVEVGRSGLCRTGYGAGRKADGIRAEHKLSILRPDWYLRAKAAR